MATVAPSLTDARAAFDREAWSDAFEGLVAADRQSPLAPEDLDCLATAGYLIGRDAEAADARTRAYDRHVEQGNAIAAARSAFFLAFTLLDRPGQQSQASGWLARARRLLDEAGRPCAERGFLLCAAGFQKTIEGDVEGAHALFGEAATVGAEFCDPDVTALARHGVGRALLRLQRKTEGLALLDEVMLGVTRGEVAPLVAGVVYCSVIGACHELFDWRRAQEWTTALAGWCTAHPDMAPFRGSCLVRRSEVMQLRGDWTGAIDEARRACEWLARQPASADLGAACAQLAELHRLRGEFDLAEERYRLASQAGARLNAGLALLRLNQGQAEAACAMIRRALQETRDRRPRAHVLRAAVEILLAAGDVPSARTAAEELSQLAAEIDAPFLHAAAATAAGAVALAADDVSTALSKLRDGAVIWQQLDAPYELARVRTLVGIAYRQMEDLDGASLEFDAAQETFERLGAAPEAAHVAALVAAAASSAAAAPVRAGEGGLTGREVEVLRLVATGRTNRAIAADLGISEKTVARHLSNIFIKLDLSSRAAATAYAYENKLV